MGLCGSHLSSSSQQPLHPALIVPQDRLLPVPTSTREGPLRIVAKLCPPRGALFLPCGCVVLMRVVP
jgi:hypothetical protein